MKRIRRRRRRRRGGRRRRRRRRRGRACLTLGRVLFDVYDRGMY